MIKKLVLIGSFVILFIAGLYFLKDYHQLLNNKPAELDGRLKIGLSFDSLVVERWNRDMETFVSYANENNLEVIVQIANDDLTEQRKQIQYLIDENVAAIVLLPKSKDSFSDLIKQAKRKGIKIIAYDRLLTDAHADAYITFDTVNIGEMITETLINSMEQQEREQYNLLIINGDPNDNNSYFLNQGFYNVLKASSNLNINIVDEVWAHDWREIYAFNAVDKALSNGEQIHGIICANDVLATGAIHSLSERQLAGKVPVVSQDSELSACQRIVEKTQLATVYKPINKLAKAAVDCTVKLINNESLSEYDTINDGTYFIPMISIKCHLVNKATIDELIIKSGFHSREDVYLNIKSRNPF
ncbi:MAG: substrate-binding domain-containing protein [Clostridia bacterium]|nr:substrate-binding domain-containing protein [Clostridia bacterium]